MNINKLIQRSDNVRDARGTAESTWQECADYCLPTVNVTKVTTPGSKLSTTLYDSTGLQSAQVFAAGLHSYMTNPSSRWFSLKVKDRALQEDVVIRRYLADVQQILFDMLNDSNFSQVIHQVYINLGVFGPAVMYMEEDPDEDVRFYSRAVSGTYWTENEKGLVDTIYRYFSFTANQAFKKWGQDAGSKVIALLKAGKSEEPVEFLHAIMPRDDRDVSKKDGKNKAYASYYIELSAKHLISEGGYDEFPFFVPRFLTNSENIYGYSPAQIALPNLKTLNAMDKTILKGSQKAVDPVVILPDDGYMFPFKVSAGAVNFRTRGANGERIETLPVGNIPIGDKEQDRRRQTVEKTFFVDLFLMLSQLNDQNRTATEITERVNERMLILSPVLGRLTSELLNPLIDRLYNIATRRGKLPPLPAQLFGQEYKITYISPLAKAQRLTEMQSIQAFLTAVLSAAQGLPEMLDRIDPDRVVKEIADIYDITGQVLRDDGEVMQVREDRQKLQQQAMEAEQAEKMAGAVDKGASAVQKIGGVQ